MITENQKIEILNNLQFYYTSRFFNLEGLKVTFNRDYKDVTDFENALYKENTRMFFRDLIAEYPDRNKGHIPTTIKIAFDDFTRDKDTPKDQQQNWLKHTYNFVKDFKDNNLSNRISKSEAVAFYEWYDVLINDFENKGVNENSLDENINITIFKNDLGQTLFNQLHKIYKNEEKNYLANYSFLFYALQKNYLVCSGTKFVNHLSTLDINIHKIDTRQSGTNTKTRLFNSIELPYLKKAQ